MPSFEPRVDGDRLYGRGAYDMKAGVAAALVACRAAARLGLAGDVVVAAVADEEHASLGVQEVLEHVLRPTPRSSPSRRTGEVIVAHKGFVWSEITLHGRAAHGSMPDEGVDAIVAAGPVLIRLGGLDAALGTRSHPLLGRGSVHASLISGGSELATLPGVAACSRSSGARCRARDGRRGGGRRRCSATVTGRTHRLLVREPFAVDPDAEIVRLVREAAGGAEIAGAPYWTDAAFIAAAGHPDGAVRAGGEGAHADVEWV